MKLPTKQRNCAFDQGRVSLRTVEIDQALAIFQQAQKINSKSAAAHIYMAPVYAVKKYPEALKEYEQAVMLDPNHVAALSSIAHVYLLLGNSNAAFHRIEQQLNKTKN